MTDIREKAINLLQSKTGLDQDHAKDAEIGIYNWCLEYCDGRKIFKSWKNNRFTQLYLEKLRSVLTNLDTNEYIQNNHLIDKIKEKEYAPHEVAFMKPDMMFPERWKETTEAFYKKFEHAFENRMEAMTNDFRCGKCKARRCVYYERQLRSSDEPSTIFIRCLECSNSWRIG
mgnify:CR=1 FL=1